MEQLFITVLILIVNRGLGCLQSPREISHSPNFTKGDVEWTLVSDSVYETTLVFDAHTITVDQGSTDAYVDITARYHNGSFPSPTMRFERGNQYRVHLINALLDESPNNPTADNVFKDPNTTNIHTHGLHIGGQSPGDSVFIKLSPGESHTYIYNIICDHAGGLFWYHPHHHGSTAMQVGSGAAGALIVEYSQSAEGLPDWLVNMKEIVLVIQYMELGFLSSIYSDDEDYVYDWSRGRDAENNFWTINGEYQPTICMTAGEWTLFRIVNVDPQESHVIKLDGCDLELVARDGVLVRGASDTDIPRSVDRMFFTTSSRADVAVHCPGDASGSASYSMYINGSFLATVDVTGTATSATTTLTQFTPVRPSYLSESFIDYTGDFQQYPVQQGPQTSTLDYFDVRVSGTGIAGDEFAGQYAYQANITINSVNEWQLSNTNGHHPLHVHVNHFQLIEMGTQGDTIPQGWFEVGDFYDTMYGEATIRFRADLFGGTVVTHCHILRHEDEGSMAVLKIIGGCDNDLTTDFEYDPSYPDSYKCNYSCSAVTYTTPAPNEEAQATADPTPEPTMSPTVVPEYEVDIWIDIVYNDTFTNPSNNEINETRVANVALAVFRELVYENVLEIVLSNSNSNSNSQRRRRNLRGLSRSLLSVDDTNITISMDYNHNEENKTFTFDFVISTDSLSDTAEYETYLESDEFENDFTSNVKSSLKSEITIVDVSVSDQVTIYDVANNVLITHSSTIDETTEFEIFAFIIMAGCATIGCMAACGICIYYKWQEHNGHEFTNDGKRIEKPKSFAQAFNGAMQQTQSQMQRQLSNAPEKVDDTSAPSSPRFGKKYNYTNYSSKNSKPMDAATASMAAAGIPNIGGATTSSSSSYNNGASSNAGGLPKPPAMMSGETVQVTVARPPPPKSTFSHKSSKDSTVSNNNNNEKKSSFASWKSKSSKKDSDAGSVASNGPPVPPPVPAAALAAIAAANNKTEEDSQVKGKKSTIGSWRGIGNKNKNSTASIASSTSYASNVSGDSNASGLGKKSKWSVASSTKTSVASNNGAPVSPSSSNVKKWGSKSKASNDDDSTPSWVKNQKSSINNSAAAGPPGPPPPPSSQNNKGASGRRPPPPKAPSRKQNGPPAWAE